tara:strand:- start:446 stop:1339 length:894 start_codon:yes stop_codon:yes gene_type:complete
MTSCLVTGGEGFIGSHIVKKLLNTGYRVTVIDDESAPENESFIKIEDSNVEYHKLRIHTDDCRHLFEDIDTVFHLAARSRIQPTVGSPGECFEVNVVGTQRVLDWSHKAGIKKVIYSGTSSLYGHQNSVPFSPNMPADCLNPYSMSKWMGEQVCKLYYQLYDVPSITLRYFNVYGPGEPTRGQYAPVIGLFKRQVEEGKPMTIIGDGTQRRDFTYIDDVVAANISAMNSNIKFGIYNVGTGKNYSISDIAKMIGGVHTTFAPVRPAEVKETLADISETTKDLSWNPKHSLEEMINSY